jgi:hypothetical protein
VGVTACIRILLNLDLVWANNCASSLPRETAYYRRADWAARFKQQWGPLRLLLHRLSGRRAWETELSE